MKNIAAVFTAEELLFIEKYTGVMLENSRDYSDDELLDIHESITENAPIDDVFESVIDKFYDHFAI